MEETKKGYAPALAESSRFYIPGVLHVERNDDLMLCGDDEEAARLVEKDGVSLLYGMEHVPDGMYVDTPENRAAIIANLEKYPEYKQAPADSCIPEISEPSPGMGMCFGKG